MTPYPKLFRTILALIKFNDIPAIPAVGYAANAIDDDDFIYFADPISKSGYGWNMVVKWRYLDEVAPDFVIPYWEQTKSDTQSGADGEDGDEP